MNPTRTFALNCFFIVCLGCSTQSLGQKFLLDSRTFSTLDGLSSNTIHYIQQDQQGFIWFAAREGLHRFDGNEFQVYGFKDGIRDKVPYRIAIDWEGNVWIYSRSTYAMNYTCAVDVYLAETGKIVPAEEHIKNIPFSVSSVYEMKGLNHQFIFFGSTENGVFRLDRQGNFEPIITRSAFPSQGFSIIDSNTLWINHNFDAEVWKAGELILEYQSSNGNRQYFLSGTQSGYYYKSLIPVDSSENSDFYTQVVHQDLVNSEKNHFPKTHVTNYPETSVNFVNDRIHLSHLNKFLVHYNGYLTIEDSLGVELQRFPFGEEISINAWHGQPTRFVDRFNNVWFPSTTGLQRISFSQNNFEHFYTADQLPGQSVYAVEARQIFQDPVSKLLLIAGNNGLVQYNLNQANLEPEVLYPALSAGLFAHGNFIYAGGMEILKIDRSENRIRDRWVSKHNYAPAWVTMPLSKWNMLVGTNTGVFILDQASGDYTDFPDVELFPESKQAFYYQFVPFHPDSFWVVSNTGLYKATKEGLKQRFWEGGEGRFKIPVSDVHHIRMDKTGDMWISSNGNGLVKWEMGSNQFEVIDVRRGLPSNEIYASFQDDQDRVWMSTNKGLSTYNLETEHIEVYSKEDGLINDEFNRLSYFQGNDGRMFFGGIGGVVSFDPRDFSVEQAEEAYPFVVTGFRQYDGVSKSIVDLTARFKEVKKITLQAGDIFFILKFALLDYKDTKKTYAYKVAGLDDQWTTIHENSVRLSNLPTGDYELRVRARNPAGSWSPNELEIPITVLGPFYAKPWFWLVSLVVIVTAVIAFVRWRTLRLKQETQRLEGIVRDRTEELAQSLEAKEVLLKEIHHRVKNNLQIVTNLLDFELFQVEDEYTLRVVKEIQNRIKSMSLVHQKLYQTTDLSDIDFGEYLGELVRMLELTYKNQNVTINIRTNEIHLDIDTAIPIGLIVNELISNSFKYAFEPKQKGSIAIELKEIESDSFKMTVQDNGKGLPVDFDLQASKSLGLKLVSILSSQLHGEANHENENGAKFTIRFKGTALRKLKA